MEPRDENHESLAPRRAGVGGGGGGGAAGCGERSPFETAPVSGKVTLNGQPLADARISFQPTDGEKELGPGSSATTDAEGKFTLSTVDGGAGATVGNNEVRISTLKMGNDPEKDDAGAVIRMSRPENILVPEKVPLKYSRE